MLTCQTEVKFSRPLSEDASETLYAEIEAVLDRTDHHYDAWTALYDGSWSVVGIRLLNVSAEQAGKIVEAVEAMVADSSAVQL